MKYKVGVNYIFIIEICNSLLFARRYMKERQSVKEEIETEEKREMASGYMFKRGGRRKNWRGRWFTLIDGFLFYYTNQQKTNYKGAIFLESSVISTCDQGITAYSFRIEIPNRTYILSCDSDENRQHWISQITACKSNSSKKGGSLASMTELFSRLTHHYLMLKQRSPDVHTIWILQWWFPLCLESYSRLYLNVCFLFPLPFFPLPFPLLCYYII